MDGKERVPNQQPSYDPPLQLQLIKTPSKSPDILTVFNMLPGISLLNQNLFASRYLPLFKSYRGRSRYYAFVFHTSRFIVTVGSITVPALLSLQSADNLKWLTWAISLAVTIFNGILTLFKIDKKYYYLHTVRGVLESEAYQFIALAGRYGKARDPNVTNSHAHQFPYFCIAMEKIRMRQIEEEYFKPDNTDKGKEQSTAQTKTDIVPASAAGQPSEEMNKWNAAAIQQQSHDDIGVPITFSNGLPLFRGKRSEKPVINSIQKPWLCTNCRTVNSPLNTKCDECNIEHPEIASSPYWTCQTCNTQISKSVYSCPKCPPSMERVQSNSV